MALISADAEPSLTIRLYDRSGLPASDVERAMRECATLFGIRGMHVEIRNCRESDSCVRDFGANEVGVRILQDTYRPDPRRLAFAFVVAGGGNLSTIYAGAVTEAATRNDVSLARVLGTTVAHEVAHLFGARHSVRGGLMSDGWTDSDYRAMGDGRLLFTRVEADALRSRIAMICTSAPGQ